MKENIALQIRKHSLPLICSIVLPVLILVYCYAQKGIYWGSDRTLLASDAFPQLSNFYASYHDVLTGKASFFYSWSGALGQNYWALSAYYINGLFTFLVAFFDKITIPDVVYLLTLLKFGAMGGSFYISSQSCFRIPKWWSAALSISYGLMSFSVAYSPMNMWLDALVYVPLIFIGLRRILTQGKPTVLFISYILLFLSNFYMGFMVGIFMSLLYLMETLQEWTLYKKRLPMYMLTSLLAGGVSMLTILPTILDLKRNGEALTPMTTFFTPDTGSWDLVAKQFIGSYDTAKFGSAPFWSVGLLPLVFAGCYFVSKKIPVKNKLLAFGLTFFMSSSIYVYPLNLFWHGLHSPNMLLFRFSFLLSFFVLYLAQSMLQRWEQTEVTHFVTVWIGLVFLFVLTFLIGNKKRYDYIGWQQFICTLVVLFIYLLAIGLWKVAKERNKTMWSRVLMVVLFGTLVVESGINTTALLTGVEKDWGYPPKASYTTGYSDIKSLLATTKQDPFHRVVNFDPITINESFNFGYSGVSQFSSIRNRGTLSYLHRLGYRSEGTNLTIEYANNTLLMDSLLGIRYQLSKQPLQKYGFEAVKKSGAYTLYHNKNALPLGMLTDKGVYKESVGRNQSNLLNYLADSSETIFRTTSLKEGKAENISKKEEGQVVYYSAEQLGKEMTMNWTVSVPAKTQAYLSLYAEDTSLMTNAISTVTVNGTTRSFSMKKVGQYYDLGYHEQATTIPVRVTFKGSSMVRFPNPDVLLLQTQALQNNVTKIRKKEVSFTAKSNHVQANVTSKKDSVLFTTIPYDRGWRVSIDGKKVRAKAFQQAFLSFPISKGQHQVQLYYIPEGFYLGLSLSILCLLLFIGYRIWLIQYTKKERGIK